MGDQKSPKHRKLKKKRFQKRHTCTLFDFRTVTAVTSQNLFTAPMNEKKEIGTKEPSVILPNRTEVVISPVWLPRANSRELFYYKATVFCGLRERNSYMASKDQKCAMWRLSPHLQYYTTIPRREGE